MWNSKNDESSKKLLITKPRHGLQDHNETKTLKIGS